MKSKTVTVGPQRKMAKRVSASAAKGAPALRWSSEPLSVYVTACALAAVALACYANSLANGFVFDDHVHVLQATVLRDLGNLTRILTDSYRPLRDVSYAVDFALWGERALGFHLTAIALTALWVRVLGASWRVTVPVALLAPLIIHLAFYKLLRVPLPWGIFERWAF